LIRKPVRDGWQGEPRNDLTLGEVRHALAERWLVLAVCALVALGVFLISAAFRGPSYTAEAEVEVRPREDAASTGSLEEGASSLLEDPALLDSLDSQAARTAGWSGSVRAFNESLEKGLDEAGGTAGETKLVEFRFTADSPGLAARAANAYARAYARRLGELDGRLAGGTVAVSGEVVREAEAATGAVPTLVVGVALVTAGGLLFGGVVALFLEGRARRWSGLRDAELTLRVPVLGLIPDHSPSEPNTKDRDADPSVKAPS